MGWRHYREQGRRWPLYWFGINAALYCIALLILTFVFLDEEQWFVRLSIPLTIIAALYAWRTCDAKVSKIWRISFAIFVLLWWAYCLMLVFWPDGDTILCYDRIQQTAFRGPLINKGPDPSCAGIPMSGLD
ncbi:hypothetical protein [Aurantiacibacter odishensis]|uniref:hypothetical protein n=1 Tax=Aurantiacibacter odishensis TaxID=1155476 RepID=UPI000E713AAA|nr:hypothetical protein [Aurantiacibacter odishensis]